MKYLEIILGIALPFIIISGAEKLKLKDGFVPAVLFGIGLLLAFIGHSEKIMFFSIGGIFLSVISGYLLSVQIMIRFGMNELFAYFLGFCVVGIVSAALYR